MVEKQQLENVEQLFMFWKSIWDLTIMAIAEIRDY